MEQQNSISSSSSEVVAPALNRGSSTSSSGSAASATVAKRSANESNSRTTTTTTTTTNTTINNNGDEIINHNNNTANGVTATTSSSSSSSSFAKQRSKPIQAGSVIPSILINLNGSQVDTADYFNQRSGIVVVLDSPFSQECNSVLQGFKVHADFLKTKVGFLGCLVQHDPHIIRAWARQLRISNEMTFLSDPTFTSLAALGLVRKDASLGLRPVRCAMLLDKGRVQWIGCGTEEAYVDSVIVELDKYLSAAA